MIKPSSNQESIVSCVPHVSELHSRLSWSSPIKVLWTRVTSQYQFFKRDSQGFHFLFIDQSFGNEGRTILQRINKITISRKEWFLKILTILRWPSIDLCQYILNRLSRNKSDHHFKVPLKWKLSLFKWDSPPPCLSWWSRNAISIWLLWLGGLVPSLTHQADIGDEIHWSIFRNWIDHLPFINCWSMKTRLNGKGVSSPSYGGK